MSSDSPQQWCQDKKETYHNTKNRLRRQEIKYSFLRLLAASMILMGPAIAVQGKGPISPYFWLLVPIGVLLFIRWVKKHTSIKNQIYFCENTLDAIKLSEASIQDARTIPVSQKRPENPVPPSETHWTLSAQETDDLDFYSEGASLYGKINRTYTDQGQKRLCGILENPLLLKEDIEERQNTLKQLTNKPEVLHLLAGNARAMGEIQDQFNALRDALKVKSNIREHFLAKFIHFYVPLTAVIIYLTYIQVLPAVAVMLLFLSNFIVAKKIESTIFQNIKPWLSVSSLINYTQMYLERTSDLPAEGKILKELQDRRKNLIDSHKLKDLNNIISKLRLRFSGVVHSVIDFTIFWDIRCICKLEKILEEKEVYHDLESLIGDWEAYVSLSIHDWINYEGSYAQITEKRELKIIDGLHPLIPRAQAIPNDIHLTPEDRTWAISGSNMSGKSTFIRTISLNALIAQVGLKTYTGSIFICPCRIMTDLRIKDNLFKEESYFLAEVRQLKRMLDNAQGEIPMFGIIDEPFRGTNSDERVASSVEVLRHLLQSRGFFLTATHDSEVTQLAEDMEGVSNHHFREDLNDDDISFDYKIRSGQATTRNAIKVLEREGYPKDIIDRANAWIVLKKEQKKD